MYYNVTDRKLITFSNRYLSLPSFNITLLFMNIKIWKINTYLIPIPGFKWTR